MFPALYRPNNASRMYCTDIKGTDLSVPFLYGYTGNVETVLAVVFYINVRRNVKLES